MFDNVARALRRAAAVRPLVVVLDDVHWADAGTLRLLRFLQPDLPRSRMLVVAAYRTDEVGGDSVQRLVLDELAARSLVLPLRRARPRRRCAAAGLLPARRAPVPRGTMPPPCWSAPEATRSWSSR